MCFFASTVQYNNKTAELNRRNNTYRSSLLPPRITSRLIILADDGIATGSTLKAAINAIKSQKPDKLVVAVPVGPPEVVNQVRGMVDDVVCLLEPVDFIVGL